MSERYFLVDRDDLGSYGSEDGEERRRFQDSLDRYADQIARGELVVIKGELIEIEVPRPLRLQGEAVQS